jgi:hypothetical protein
MSRDVDLRVRVVPAKTIIQMLGMNVPKEVGREMYGVIMVERIVTPVARWYWLGASVIVEAHSEYLSTKVRGRSSDGGSEGRIKVTAFLLLAAIKRYLLPR